MRLCTFRAVKVKTPAFASGKSLKRQLPYQLLGYIEGDEAGVDSCLYGHVGDGLEIRVHQDQLPLFCMLVRARTPARCAQDLPEPWSSCWYPR